MADQWQVRVGSKRYGPFTGKQLLALARQGKIKATYLVSKDGGGRWVAASAVRGLLPAAGSSERLPAVKPPPAAVAPVSAVRQAAPSRGATASRRPKATSRTLILGGLAGAVLAGGVVTAFMLLGSSGRKSDARAVAGGPSRPPQAAEPATAPGSEAPPPETPPPPPSPEPEAPPETPVPPAEASTPEPPPPEPPPTPEVPPPEPPPPPEEPVSPEEQLRRHVRAEMAACQSFPFTLTAADVSGREQSLESLRGKVVVVDLWGTWCPPCRAEIPSFVRLQEELGPQGLQVLGINFERGQSAEENTKVVTDFVAEQRVTYPCILGDGGTLQQVPNLRGFPTTLFVDRSGKVRLMVVGARPYEYLAAVVNELLAEPDAGGAAAGPHEPGMGGDEAAGQ